MRFLHILLVLLLVSCGVERPPGLKCIDGTYQIDVTIRSLTNEGEVVHEITDQSMVVAIEQHSKHITFGGYMGYMVGKRQFNLNGSYDYPLDIKDTKLRFFYRTTWFGDIFLRDEDRLEGRFLLDRKLCTEENEEVKEKCGESSYIEYDLERFERLIVYKENE